MPEPLEVNRLILTARIAQISALRYTPAGLPALDLELQHESQQSEAQVPRTVQLSIKAVAFGELTQGLMALEPAQMVHFKGFLVSPRYGKSVTFHVQDFKTS